MISFLSYLIMLWLASALPQLEEIHTPHFYIRHTPDTAGLARQLSLECEHWKSHVEKTTGLTIDSPVTVIVTGGNQDFQRAQPEGSNIPVWAAAVAYPSLKLIIIKGERGRSALDLENIFLHEYSHLLLGTIFTRNPIPDWLHEGLAMRLAGEWSISRALTMSEAVLGDRIIPLDKLVVSFPDEEHLAQVAYAESYYVISFFLSEFGSGALAKFIKDYGRGFGFENALYRSTGLKKEVFEQRWKRFVRLRFSWLPIISGAGGLWFLISLLFILAYLRKKKRARRTLEAWHEEEDHLQERNMNQEQN
jgi:hypothetical protein